MFEVLSSDGDCCLFFLLQVLAVLFVRVFFGYLVVASWLIGLALTLIVMLGCILVGEIFVILLNVVLLTRPLGFVGHISGSTTPLMHAAPPIVMFILDGRIDVINT